MTSCSGYSNRTGSPLTHRKRRYSRTRRSSSWTTRARGAGRYNLWATSTSRSRSFSRGSRTFSTT